jgi:hypothetical protein
MKIFGVGVEGTGYGISFYALAEAATREEAELAVTEKFGVLPCGVYHDPEIYEAEIEFDENGVSQLLKHSW